MASDAHFSDSPSNHEQQSTHDLREVIVQSGLQSDVEHTCPYLSDRAACNTVFTASQLPQGVYHSFMDLNFRRSGKLLYQPSCRNCKQCQAVRVLTGEFKPNRTQQRCLRRNHDLTVDLSMPFPTDEKFALYTCYLQQRHEGQMSDDWQSFVQFLYASPVFTLEVTYRLNDHLVGVGLIDIEPSAISTVYCYFDPDLPKRSLGVFNVLWTIEYGRQQHIPYAYLGYYIRDSHKMNYKLNYKPCEILTGDDAWQRHERNTTAQI